MATTNSDGREPPPSRGQAIAGNEQQQAKSKLAEDMQWLAAHNIPSTRAHPLAQEQEQKGGELAVHAAAAEDAFTLVRLGLSLAKIGADDDRMVREFAQRLLERARQRLAYIEEIVGKLR